MPRVECSVVINQPIDKVFMYTTNPANFINWQPWVLDSQSDRRIGVGSQIEVISRFMGQRLDMTTQVIEYVPNKRIAAQGAKKSFFKKMQYTFERDNGGTKVNYTVDFEPRGFIQQMLGPMLVNRFRKAVEDSFLQLKGLLEAEY